MQESQTPSCWFSAEWSTVVEMGKVWLGPCSKMPITFVWNVAQARIDIWVVDEMRHLRRWGMSRKMILSTQKFPARVLNVWWSSAGCARFLIHSKIEMYIIFILGPAEAWHWFIESARREEYNMGIHRPSLSLSLEPKSRDGFYITEIYTHICCPKRIFYSLSFELFTTHWLYARTHKNVWCRRFSVHFMALTAYGACVIHFHRISHPPMSAHVSGVMLSSDYTWLEISTSDRASPSSFQHLLQLILIAKVRLNGPWI